jgi:hypothetical protein
VNILTILLCLFLIDDRVISKSKVALSKITSSAKTTAKYPTVIAALLIFSVSVPLMSEMILQKPSAVLSDWSHTLRRFGIGNVYHVFPTMQTERHELIIQGSNDRREWKTYQFHHKPGELNQLPKFIVPHQPRLDWMIWFVPAQHNSSKPWFNHFMDALRRGNPSVTHLLALNPFPDQPPQFMRVLSYRYQFNSFKEAQLTGNFWRRELIGEFPHVPARIP